MFYGGYFPGTARTRKNGHFLGVLWWTLLEQLDLRLFHAQAEQRPFDMLDDRSAPYCRGDRMYGRIEEGKAWQSTS
jgi:hypothetical protein